MNTLSIELQRYYFTSYAHAQRDLSPATIAAYRDTWRLLITYLSSTFEVSADDVGFELLNVEVVTGFLDHLEHDRGNSVTTRNARLSAIRAVLAHAQAQHPEHAGTITRVLSIPAKRHPKPMLEFLTPNEAEALVAAPDRGTWTGARDHALLVLAIQTGLRISELCSLSIADVHLGAGAHVTCTGKGRRRRSTPLTTVTSSVLADYLPPRTAKPGSAFFCGPHGQHLSRDAVEHRLAVHLATARGSCPSLAAKKVTMHTLRHTAAMNLLAAGVDITVIALWLGHQHTNTTDIYLHADMNIKQAAIDRTRPPSIAPARPRHPRLAQQPLIMPTFQAASALLTCDNGPDIGITRRSA